MPIMTEYIVLHASPHPPPSFSLAQISFRELVLPHYQKRAPPLPAFGLLADSFEILDNVRTRQKFHNYR